MEDASDLAPEIHIERILDAGTKLATAARRLGQRADEADAACEAVEVVWLGEKAVIDGRWNPRIGRAQRDAAA